MGKDVRKKNVMEEDDEKGKSKKGEKQETFKKTNK